MKKFGIFVLCLFWLGCGFDQDPLSSYPKRIREGEPPIKKPNDDRPKYPPIIDVNDYYMVQELNALKFSISGRVFQPDIQWGIRIDNMSEFPGATFDAGTGEFIWVPATGVVSGVVPVSKTLQVALVVQSEPIYVVNKDINIFISRKTQDPVIETVEGLNPNQILYEGVNYIFKVKVRMAREGEMPRLIVPAIATDNRNGAGLVTFDKLEPILSPLDSKLWIFSMGVQLRDVDLTNYRRFMTFGLQAFSPFGEASAIIERSMNIYTSLMTPIITWSTDAKFTAGKKNTLEFIIMDPRGEGKISVEHNCSSILGVESRCYCSGPQASKNCTIEWLPDATKGNKTYTIELRARNQSPIGGDSRYEEAVFNKRISVAAAEAFEVKK